MRLRFAPNVSSKYRQLPRPARIMDIRPAILAGRPLYLLRQARQRLRLRQARRGEFVFDIPSRGRKDLLRRTVAQIAKRTGIDFGFHVLRHYFTTALLEKGVDLVTIGPLLGHSKISTSLIYSHTDRAKQKKAVDLLYS